MPSVRPKFKSCPSGRTIGVFKGAVGTIPPGDCEACGLGPLHAPRHAGGGCTCSFIRHDHRLCRVCAYINDVLEGKVPRWDAGIDPRLIQSLARRIQAILGVMQSG